MPKDDCQKLRSCPFCGGKAEVWVSDVTDRTIVYCTVCDAQIRIRQNEQEAIEAWNKRVPPTSKELEEYIEKTHKENKELVAKLKRKYEVKPSCDTCAMYFPDDGCMAGLAEEVES